MEWILFIAYISIFIFIIFKLKFFNSLPFSPYVTIGIFLLKVLAGFGLLWIYTYYYSDRLSSDVFKYFDDGKAIFKAFQTGHYLDFFKMVTGINCSDPNLHIYYDHTNFWFKNFNYNLYNDNRTIIRFNALALIFSHGNIYINSLFISFLSFLGSIALFKSFSSFFKKKKYELLFATFLIPSVIFWSSGLLKEGLLMLGLGYLIWSITLIAIKPMTVKSIVLFLLSVFLMYLTKLYVLVSLIPGILSYLVIKKFPKYSLVKFVGIHLLFLVLVLINPIPKFNLIEITAQKQHDFINVVKVFGNVDSYYEIPQLNPNFTSFLTNAPTALFNSLFRPLPKDIHKIIMLPPFAENLLLLLLLILLIFYRSKLSNNFLPLLYMSISFVLIFFILIGLTTPVIGALVRYKVPGLPFLFIIIFYFLDTSRIVTKLKQIFLKNKLS